jgi:hypothetical protein
MFGHEYRLLFTMVQCVIRLRMKEAVLHILRIDRNMLNRERDGPQASEVRKSSA